MAVWPFGRSKKSSRDASVATEKTPLAARPVNLNANPAPARAAKDTPPRTPRKLSRSESNRRRRASTQSDKRGKQPPEPPRHDPMPLDAQSTAERMRHATAQAAAASPPEVKEVKQAHRDGVPPYDFKHALSNTSIQSEHPIAWQRPPTLRAKRSANHDNDPGLLRRKSSKKRKSDHVREEEIKSMSAPVPIPKRPTTHGGGGGGPLRRDSKKVPGGLNKHLERPTSDISLPLPESLHSSFSSSSDRRGFKVRSLDVFTPRPTIRYSQQGRYPASQSLTWDPTRANSKREHRHTIPEETFKHSKTIDELADGLDAGGLRELMERDERRRERKRKSDTDKAKRRLQRKADRQSKEPDRDAPPDLDRGYLGREGPGHETGESSKGPAHEQVVADDTQQRENTSPLSWLHDPSKEYLQHDPFADREALDSRPRTEEPTPAEEADEPILGTAQAVRVSQASLSPPSSPKYNIFAPPAPPPAADLNRLSTTDVSESVDADPRASTASDQQLYGSSWTSFLRRSFQRPKRHSADTRAGNTPSEFSNTSRDSLQQRQPRSVPYQSSARRRSGPPGRTTSKFREDLPELPISPPDSRMQSPDTALHENVIPERAESSLAEKISMAASSIDPRDPFADPASRPNRDRSARGSRSLEAPSPEGGAPSTVVSQSLASIDSEGSWLSGRPAKRNSQPLSSPVRESGGSLPKRYQDYSDSAEELGVAEDEYFSRLTPGPEPSYEPEAAKATRKASSTAMGPEPGDEDDQERQMLHGTVARQPTIVHHGTRAKSSEGLLNQFQEGEASVVAGSPVDEDSPASVTNRSFDLPADDDEFASAKPYRATSVDLGMKHVRHISAGSAKLLDIQPRASGEQKRMSAASQASQS